MPSHDSRGGHPLFCFTPAIRGASLAMLALLMTAGCGRSSHPVPTLAAAHQPPAGSMSADGLDYHSRAVEQHNMNVAAGDPGLVRVDVSPQQPVDFASPDLGVRGASSLAALAQALPAPATLPVADPTAARHASTFTPDDLIVDGGSFDPALPLYHTAPATDPGVASFDTNTDPYQPDISQGAYAVYRFTLNGYAASGQPQSVGTLWADSDAPNTYYVGLSNWQTGYWEWYGGSLDNVVTVASLAPYIRASDDSMLVAVYVLDNEARDLVLLQAGAEEVRGMGAQEPTDPASLDITTPDKYFDGKTTSTVNGVPATYQVNEDWIGPVYNQGQVPMCQCCSTAGELNYNLSRIYSPVWSASHPWERISPKWTYMQIGSGGVCTTHTRDEANNYLLNFGGATMNNAPLNANCTTDFNSPACNADAPFLKINYWQDMNCAGGAGVDNLKNQLANGHLPIEISMTLSDNFEPDVAAGLVYEWTGDKADWKYGHSMLLIGYDDSKQAFRVRNSWGEEWGDHGDFWLAYENFSSNAGIYCSTLICNYNQDAVDYFDLNNLIETPYNIDCSRADPDKIAVSWSPVDNADGYLLFRDIQVNPIATLGAGQTSYDDTSITDKLAHDYWVQTVMGDKKSPQMAWGEGWRAQTSIPPVIRHVLYDAASVTSDTDDFNASIGNRDGSALDFSWSFPTGAVMEGTIISTRNPTLTADQPGTYTATLTVTNDAGQDSVDFPFTVEAVLPTASFTLPAEVGRNKVSYFDASSSTADTGHTVTGYFWDWNGDGVPDFGTNNSQFAHIFTQPGPASLGLLVSDDAGLQSGWTYQNFNVTVPTSDWVHSAGFYGHGGVGNAVAADTAGNVYIAGSTSSDGSQTGALLCKYGNAGALQWSKVDTGSIASTESFVSVAVDASGEVAAGSVFSDVSFATEMLVMKFDASGNVLWKQSWLQDSSAKAYCVALDSAGNVYVAGQSSDGSPHQTSIVLKLDPDGNLLWQKAYSSADTDYLSGICYDQASSSVIAAGQGFGATIEEIGLLKLSSAGALVFDNRYESNAALPQAQAAAVTTDGSSNIYVCGSGKGLGGGTANSAFIARISANGNSGSEATWENNIVANAFQRFNSIFLADDGSLYTAGQWWDFASVQTGQRFGVLAKWDASLAPQGSQIWDRGPTGDVVLYGVAQAPNDGQLILAGQAPDSSGSWNNASPVLAAPTLTRSAWGGTLSNASGTMDPPAPNVSDATAAQDGGDGSGDALAIRRGLL